MDLSRQTEAIRIELDLHELRSQAEQSAGLDAYTRLASELPSEIRQLLSSSPGIVEFEVHGQPAKQPHKGTLPSKVSPQVLDGVTILLAPMGVAGLFKLILSIIEVTRPKFPAVFELQEEGVGQVKLSGESLTPSDVREAERLIQKMKEGRIVLKGKNPKPRR